VDRGIDGRLVGKNAPPVLLMLGTMGSGSLQFKKMPSSEGAFMKYLCVGVMWLIAGITPALAEVVGQELEYKAGDTNLKGYLAYDDSIDGRRPGILVVHEWWGQNAYARKRADMLAELGYVALALDMYGDGRLATHPEDAGKMASEISSNIELSRQRFMAALDLLKQQRWTDANNIAAIGYCFGGGVVLQMAREGVDLDGVVSFHGSLATDHPAQPGRVKARILVATGADDPFNPPEAVKAFEEEMKHAGADFRIISYPGAKHSFTNPDADALGKRFNLPLEYNKEADEESWAEMRSFFKTIFGTNDIVLRN